MTVTQSFETRANIPSTHPLTSYLYELIATKRTNLCLSADVTSTSALLKVAEDVGEYICVLKTHADIIDDFGERTIRGLKDISRRKKFLIFEDRKFGDIGHTVQGQYTRGPLRIADWAHIVNCHVFPGPAIVTALKQAGESAIARLSQSVSTEVYTGTPLASADEDDEEDEQAEASRNRPLHGKTAAKSSSLPLARKGSIVTTTQIYQTVEPREGHKSPNRVRSPPSEGAARGGMGDDEIPDPPLLRGLLLLAEMSSVGNLMTGEYTQKCKDVARENEDFVMGFIAQRSLNESDDNFVCLTPGVSLPAEGDSGVKGDALGQQYRTPSIVIGNDGCDVIIVGRGILGAKERATEAKRYRDEAWKAYKKRIEA